MNLTIAWPYAFAALPLPLFMGWLLPRTAGEPRTALRIPFFAAVKTESAMHTRRSKGRLIWVTLAWILLISAAGRPQFLGEPLHLPVSGRDLLLSVDISGSMQTKDMFLGKQQSDRLTAVKAVAGEFIQRRGGDRLGLILFGQQAYLQTPLTFDRKTVRTLLYEAAIGLAGKETAIGDAIGLAIKHLRDQPQENRVVILLTDGANTAGTIDPLKAADLAAQEGVRIYTIGVGADEILVQSLFGLQRINPSVDLDEETLGTIAAKTGGEYFRALDTENLERIYQLLDELEPVTVAEETFRPIKELYAWPLTAALAITVGLALLAIRLPERQRLTKRIDYAR